MTTPRCWFASLALALALGTGTATAWTLVLADHAAVSPGNVRVADLAVGDVPEPAGRVVIIPGVQPGFAGEVSARTILRRLVLAGQAAGLQLAGATACRITASGATVATDDLTERVRALLTPHAPPDLPDAPPGWLEVSAPSLDVVTGGRWQVTWPDAGPLVPGRNLVTLVLESEHVRRRFSIAVTVHTYARTPQAVVTLPRGQELDPSTLGWVWADLAVAPSDVVVAAGALDGMMVAREIGPGEAVTTRDLSPRPLVHRGQLVDLLVQRGRVEAVVRAECRQDGHQGELVSVLNPLTKRPVLASVVGPGVVTLGR